MRRRKREMSGENLSLTMKIWLFKIYNDILYIYSDILYIFKVKIFYDGIERQHR